MGAYPPGVPQKPRRDKTPIQLWVLDNRKRLKEESSDLAKLVGVTTDTARGWESRGRPSEDAIRILERHFDVAAPVAGASGDTPAPADLSDLYAKLDAQADAINELAAQVKRLADRSETELATALVELVRSGLLAGAPSESPVGGLPQP